VIIYFVVTSAMVQKIVWMSLKVFIYYH